MRFCLKYLFVLTALALAGSDCYSLVRYAAAERKGAATGLSADNAADFLDGRFWNEIRSLLKKDEVLIHLLSGDYRRAYLENPLVLKNLGHQKHRLVIEGEGEKTVFYVPENGQQKATLFDIVDSENILIRNLSFTGNGKLGYALRILSSKGNETKNIQIESCTWKEMRGIIYGATGCHQAGTHDITFSNCVFRQVGIDSHSHHMYHAHGANMINVLDSHFEDCTGDYVRFRDNCDMITVKGSTFVRNNGFPEFPFISVPLFNNVDPGDETFSSNFILEGNKFNNTHRAIAFHVYGFSSPEFSYLLNLQQGETLTSGLPEEKKKLLKSNFGIDVSRISIRQNTYTNITTRVGMGTFAKYGTKSLGFDGWGDISELFD